jgi:hypothetical protein
LVLFELGIFNEALMLASTSLFDAAESEDSETDAEHATNCGDDSNLGARREAIPFLGSGLSGGLGVLAVKLDSLSLARGKSVHVRLRRGIGRNSRLGLD